MDELTFLLILSGIGLVLLVAIFTYYKHHKKIHDEIQDFNYHADSIDDVLLQDNTKQKSFSDTNLRDDELPNSFSATKKDSFDINQVNLINETTPGKKPVSDAKLNERELVDGVYINSKRVISTSIPQQNPTPSFKKTTDAFQSYSDNESSEKGSSSAFQQQDTDHTAVAQQQESQPVHQPAAQSDRLDNPLGSEDTKTVQPPSQNIKVVYDQVPEGVDELIISHTILAKDQPFTGRQLFHVFNAVGLSYGEMNIFHFPGNDKKPETFALFSVANAVEPGTFNLEQANSFTTPGISIFMRLPTRIGSFKAYDKFIRTAQLIAAKLNGELCDETRNPLTQQSIGYKKEQINKLNYAMAKAEKLSGLSR